MIKHNKYKIKLDKFLIGGTKLMEELQLFLQQLDKMNENVQKVDSSNNDILSHQINAQVDYFRQVITDTKEMINDYITNQSDTQEINTILQTIKGNISTLCNFKKKYLETFEEYNPLIDINIDSFCIEHNIENIKNIKDNDKKILNNLYIINQNIREIDFEKIKEILNMDLDIINILKKKILDITNFLSNDKICIATLVLNNNIFYDKIIRETEKNIYNFFDKKINSRSLIPDDIILYIKNIIKLEKLSTYFDNLIIYNEKMIQINIDEDVKKITKYKQDIKNIEKQITKYKSDKSKVTQIKLAIIELENKIDNLNDFKQKYKEIIENKKTVFLKIFNDIPLNTFKKMNEIYDKTYSYEDFLDQFNVNDENEIEKTYIYFKYYYDTEKRLAKIKNIQKYIIEKINSIDIKNSNEYFYNIINNINKNILIIKYHKKDYDIKTFTQLVEKYLKDYDNIIVNLKKKYLEYLEENEVLDRDIEHDTIEYLEEQNAENQSKINKKNNIIDIICDIINK
jgi:hypothetical protein